MDNLYKFEELTPREQAMVGQAMGWDGTSYNAPDGVKVTLHGGEVSQYSVEYPAGIERSATPVESSTEPKPELPETPAAPAEETTPATIPDAAAENLPVPEPTDTIPQDVPSTDGSDASQA